MVRILIITFDLIREGRDPSVSYSASCLLSYLRSRTEYGNLFTVDHLSINQIKTIPSVARLMQLVATHAPLVKYDFLAMSDFIWCHHWINPFIAAVRSSGWQGRFIIGGPQINHIPENEIGANYPSLIMSDDFLIRGFAERAMEQIVLGKADNHLLPGSPRTTDLPSPYLFGTIPVRREAPMVRWETRRGYCMYSCDYCESRRLDDSSTLEEIPIDRLLEEIKLFKKRHIREVNVLDLVFNYKLTTREILVSEMLNSGITFKVQCRLELLDNSFFEIFTNQSKFHFEFGIQSVDEKTCNSLGRKNNIKKMEENLKRIALSKLSYNVNLIYGIPRQTVESFQRDIDWLCRNQCKPQSIVCFPLQIPRYSNLEQKKVDNNVTERILPFSFVPIVTSSLSFSEEDFLRMHSIASRLKNGSDRVFGSHYMDLGSMNSFAAIATVKHFSIFQSSFDGSFDWIFNSKRLFIKNRSSKNSWKLLSPKEAVFELSGNKEIIIKKNRFTGKSYLVISYFFDFSRDECVFIVQDSLKLTALGTERMHAK